MGGHVPVPAFSPADTHFPEDWIASTTRAINPPDATRHTAAASQLPEGLSAVHCGDDPTPYNFADLLAADTKRPWSLKQRISGRHGHLSNEATRELLAAIASPRWRRIYLTHLSSECNSPAAVEQALAGVRATLPACAFAVVPPGVSTPWCELG